jgi:hypothetical protein
MTHFDRGIDTIGNDGIQPKEETAVKFRNKVVARIAACLRKKSSIANAVPDRDRFRR